ncbi:MAG: nuclear transport factor 2 family protein [Bacteroidales bacterium]|nr:nuclear transport factor 2 family protein [Bacteroidales bacterium]
MTITEIATAFANGQFEQTFPYLSDNVEWIVIEQNKFVGKNAVLKNCKQVSNYFKSITTYFNTLNVISDNNKVVINGTAEFLRDRKQLSFVSACDVYEFDDNKQLVRITSYCVQKQTL